ncbi:MAG: ferritin-like protein [Ignavibacteriae bacterium]|nr:ferritin-like protein [Ignavibacteriota bacterium]MCB9215901.1 ferritin-like protein [Ignavibacteria bacterium]
MNITTAKAPLFEKLQKGAELELATLPPYLTAMWSIKPGTNIPSSVAIRSVFMEEMLHLTLATNILSSIGGSVRLGEAEIPKYPLVLEFDGTRFKDREVDIQLAPFSKESMWTFMQIELPANFAPDEIPQEKAELEVPGFTIGEFYQGIKSDLTDLVEEYGEEAVFSGDPRNQVSEEFYWHGGGKPIVVRNLSDASEAIDVICDQGEGADGTLFDGDNHFFGQPEEIAHYFRFKQIYSERYYAKTDNIHSEPSGPIFPVTYDDVYPIKPNCTSADFAGTPELENLNNRFNAHYSMMLSQLEQGFRDDPTVLYTAIMNGMRGLTPIAQAIMQTPINGDPEGRTGCPTFEWRAPITVNP